MECYQNHFLSSAAWILNVNIKCNAYTLTISTPFFSLSLSRADRNSIQKMKFPLMFFFAIFYRRCSLKPFHMLLLFNNQFSSLKYNSRDCDALHLHHSNTRTICLSVGVSLIWWVTAYSFKTIKSEILDCFGAKLTSRMHMECFKIPDKIECS